MKAHARTLDPKTSHDAARSVRNLTETQQLILNLFNIRINGYTDEELIEAYNKAYKHFHPATDASIRSRRADLVKRGDLRATEIKRSTRANRGSTVWELASRLL